MPIVARVRFFVGRHACGVRTYELRGRDSSRAIRFSIGSLDARDVASGESELDVVRAVRAEAHLRSARVPDINHVEGVA